MDANDFRAKLAWVDAILDTQSQVIDAWCEYTQRTVRLLQENGTRQAKLTRELLAVTESAFREMRPPANSGAAIVGLASFGWESAQEASRDYGTLCDDIYRAITAGCRAAIAPAAEP